MPKHYFKILLFSLLYTLCPMPARAEMLLPGVVQQHEMGALEKRSTGEARSIKVEGRKESRFARFWAHARTKSGGDKVAWLVIGIILLVLLTFLLCVMYVGLLFLSMPMGAPGQPDTWTFPMLSLLFLVLPALCIFGIVRLAKKIRRLKEEDISGEKFPQRPPSRNLKKQ